MSTIYNRLSQLSSSSGELKISSYPRLVVQHRKRVSETKNLSRKILICLASLSIAAFHIAVDTGSPETKVSVIQVRLPDYPISEISHVELNQQAVVLATGGDLAKAKELIEEAVRLAPEKPLYKLNQALILEATGDLKSALRILKQNNFGQETALAQMTKTRQWHLERLIGLGFVEGH